MEHLPPWLRNVPLPPRPRGSDAASGAAAPPDWLVEPGATEPPVAPPAAAAPAAGDDGIPDWLLELQSEVGSYSTGETDTYSRPAEPPPAARTPSDDDDVPDWLREAEPLPLTPPAEQSGPFEASDWLNSLAQETPPPAPAEPEPPSVAPPSTTTTSRIRMPVGATDWLRSIGQEPDISEPLPAEVPAEDDKNGVPDWLRDVSAEDLAEESLAEEQAAAPEPRGPSVFDPQTPDWLREDFSADSTVSADSSETVAADDVPDWLRDVAGPLPSGDEQPRQRDPGSVPDWLKGDDKPGGRLASDIDVPDWLRDVSSDESPAQAQAPQATPSPEREPASDIPAWLRGDESTPAPTTPPEPANVPAEEEEVPAWLREAEAGMSVSAPPMSEPAGEEEVPAWLREAEVSTPPPGEPEGEEEMPAWLREAEASTPPTGEPEGEEEMPAWLREAEASAAPSAGAKVDAEEVPAWLREAEASPSGEQPVPTWLREAVEGQGPAEPEGEPPAWLREIENDRPDTPGEEPPTWLRDAVGDDLPTAAIGSGKPGSSRLSGVAPPPPPSTPNDLPPWLVADSPGVESTPGTPAPGEANLPSWLRGVADEASAQPVARSSEPPAPRRRASARSEDKDSGGFLRGADLPSWLRVPEPEIPTESPEGQALDWLTRLGSPDEGESESSVSAGVATVAVPHRPLYQRSNEQMEAIGLLDRLVRSPYPEPAAAPLPVTPSRWQRIGLDRLLYLLLIVVLLAGLLVPQLSVPLQTTSPQAPGVAELSSLLDSLDSEDVVLVAYEWGAQRSAELRPLEQAVTSRLIARKAKLILVSTDLQGTLLSFDLIEPLRAAGYNIDPDKSVFGGRDYVLLGYRPGGELALRSLAQNLRGELSYDFEGRDASQGLLATNLDGSPRVSSIADLSMIIVMADQPQDVQAWMEQVHSATPAVPIAFLLPQEAQPQAQPYLRLSNVYGLAGRQGALALSAQDANVDPAAVAGVTGQQGLAVVGFVVLLLLGGIAAVIGRARAARRGAA